ncbi:Uncharacterized protein TCM_032662 [Theobroma cacao]|uniref:Uncharacterized protein n=1 Tax=Theobroma cacao TaxID=3641 RepID=A0A061FAZ1_THECC|nr:Uncharacterized protein TCM_032662 [Theobroma cacao]
MNNVAVKTLSDPSKTLPFCGSICNEGILHCCSASEINVVVAEMFVPNLGNVLAPPAWIYSQHIRDCLGIVYLQWVCYGCNNG